MSENKRRLPERCCDDLRLSFDCRRFGIKDDFPDIHALKLSER